MNECFINKTLKAKEYNKDGEIQLAVRNVIEDSISVWTGTYTNKLLSELDKVILLKTFSV